MKPKRPPHPSPQVLKAARTKRIPKLNPAYYGNIACLIRLYLRICRNPYLHLPRVRANRAAWGFVERWRGHFYLDLGLDLPVGQSEWYCVFRACLLPGSLQQGDEEAEEHFDDILKAMSMMFYLPTCALAQPQSTVCNKTVLLPKAARPPQNDKQRTELLQKLFFNSHIADACRRLVQDGGILYFVLDRGNPTKRRPLRALIDETAIQPCAEETERQNAQAVLAFYREMADFLQSGLPQKTT